MDSILISKKKKAHLLILSTSICNSQPHYSTNSDRWIFFINKIIKKCQCLRKEIKSEGEIIDR
jgi:hypothetical protein